VIGEGAEGTAKEADLEALGLDPDREAIIKKEGLLLQAPEAKKDQNQKIGQLTGTTESIEKEIREMIKKKVRIIIRIIKMKKAGADQELRVKVIDRDPDRLKEIHKKIINLITLLN
jgi:hypothetical protein